VLRSAEYRSTSLRLIISVFHCPPIGFCFLCFASAYNVSTLPRSTSSTKQHVIMSKQHSTNSNSHDDDDDRNYPFKKSFAPIKYKKAPNAPRRFKSSYMFFSTQKHKEIREERTRAGEDPKVSIIPLRFLWLSSSVLTLSCYLMSSQQLSTTEVAKMVSQAWKDMPEEEREKWEEMGRKDKARYEMEKAMYSGPWKVPVTTKREKDPTRPKRPMSAFLSYSNRKRAEVKEKNKNSKTADVSRILAHMWKEAPPEEKKEFIDEEYSLRQDYKAAMAAWKERTEKEFTRQREARESEAMKLVLEGKLPPDPFPLTSATTLPTGTEYSTKMDEDAFDIDNTGHTRERKHASTVAMSGYPPSNAGFPGIEGNSSNTAAAFQPPLDPVRRSADAGAYLYGAYMQPPLYGYQSSIYSGEF
jgi:hypothetical protein